MKKNKMSINILVKQGDCYQSLTYFKTALQDKLPLEIEDENIVEEIENALRYSLPIHMATTCRFKENPRRFYEAADIFTKDFISEMKDTLCLEYICNKIPLHKYRYKRKGKEYLLTICYEHGNPRIFERGIF